MVVPFSLVDIHSTEWIEESNRLGIPSGPKSGSSSLYVVVNGYRLKFKRQNDLPKQYMKSFSSCEIKLDGAQARNHVVAVQTSRRPKGDTLSRTIDSLDREGCDAWEGRKLIVSDGYLPPSFAGWTSIKSSQDGMGSSYTMIQLFKEAVAVCPDIEMLTYAQDDIVVSHRAMDFIKRLNVPQDLAFVSWFSTSKAPCVDHPVLVSKSISGFMRNQMLTIPRRSLIKMIESPEATTWPFRFRCDRFLAVTLRDSDYGVFFPSLAQHIAGSNSACKSGAKHERKSPSFQGYEYDVNRQIRGDT